MVLSFGVICPALLIPFVRRILVCSINFVFSKVLILCFIFVPRDRGTNWNKSPSKLSTMAMIMVGLSEIVALASQAAAYDAHDMHMYVSFGGNKCALRAMHAGE